MSGFSSFSGPFPQKGIQKKNRGPVRKTKVYEEKKKDQLWGRSRGSNNDATMLVYFKKASIA